MGYVWLTIGVNPLYVDTGIRIESAADLCCKCLDDVATDVLYMTGNDHALEAADPLELAPNILFLGNFALSRTVIKGTITPNKSSIPHFGTQYDDVLILHFFIVKNVQNDNRTTKVDFTELRDLQKWLTSPKLPCSLFVLEPGGINHSESNRIDQFKLIRNSQCTNLSNCLLSLI